MVDPASSPEGTNHAGNNGAPPGNGNQAQPVQGNIITKARAFQYYQRLIKMANCIKEEDEHHSLYLGIARDVLELFPIPEPADGGNDPADMPEAIEVLEVMADMLPGPFAVFTQEYYSKPPYPVKVLYQIAKLYGFSAVPREYGHRMCISPYEAAHQGVVMQVWLAHTLGIDPSSARSIVDLYVTARSLAPSSQTTDAAQAQVQIAPPAAVEPMNQPRSETAGRPVQQNAEVPGGQLARYAREDRGSRTQATRNTADAGTEGADTRKANYVSQQFAGRKFKGDLKQSIDLLLRDYEACARQHQLTAAQKAEYFINTLEGPARTYHLNHFVFGMTYDEVAEMMRREYDSDSRQLQVQNKLECINLETFMADNSLTTHTQGLTKLVEEIELLRSFGQADSTMSTWIQVR